MDNTTKIKRAIGILLAVMIFPTLGMVLASVKGDALMIGFLEGMVINIGTIGISGLMMLIAWLCGAFEDSQVISH